MQFTITSRLASLVVLSAVVATVSIVVGGIFADDNVGPDVSIVSPTDGFATNSDTVQVSVHFLASANPNGNANSATGNVKTIILTIDDEEVARHENPPQVKEGSLTFSVDISAYTDGIVNLQAFAFQGNEKAELVGESIVVSLVIDRTSPDITVSQQPQPNASGWNNTDVTVVFSATDGLSGIASSTSPVVVTTEGSAQVVTGTAFDLAGNNSSISISLNIDKTAPAIAIGSPQDGERVTIPVATITGAATDLLSGLTGVSCDNSPAILVGDTFACDVPLIQGANTVFVEATDSADNLASTNITINFVPGSVSIPIEIESPENLSLFNSSPVSVTGTVGNIATSVEVNGISATLGAGTFSALVSLQEGTSVITAVAQGSGGEVGTDSVQIVLDTTAPTVVIDTPITGLITGQVEVTVTGSVNDMVTGTINGQDVSITCNGVSAAVLNRSFAASDVTLRLGPNTISCDATDAAGNSSTSEAVQVTRQNLVGQIIELVSGTSQTGTVNNELTDPLIVRLEDTDGSPIAGRNVNFEVSDGGGTLRNSSAGLRIVDAVTDTNGEAGVFFTLGAQAGVGNHKVTASATGFVGEVVFLASAGPDNPDKILAISGGNQRGAVGQDLPLPFIGLVLDTSGNPLQNVHVTFTVVQGGGLISGGASFSVDTDDDGRVAAILTLGPDAGINNNVVQADFVGNPSIPASFVASSDIPGLPQDTRVSGVVLDNSNVPIPGATVRILDTALDAATDDEGQFIILGSPVGSIVLEIDGATSSRPETFPKLQFHLTTIAGQDNDIGMPILMPALDMQGSQVCGGSTDCVLQMAGVAGMELQIFANSVTFVDGSDVGDISFTQVQLDKVPMPPANGSVFTPAWTVQPAGVRFAPPARISIPNTVGLAPGESAEIFQFDHDLMEFIGIGPGTVTDDGSVVVSDPGFGITKSGWGGFQQPPPPPSCTKNISVNITSAPQFLGVGQTVNITALGSLQVSGSNCASVQDSYSWSASGSGSVSFPMGNTGANLEIEGDAPGNVTLKITYSGAGVSDTDSSQIGVIGVEITEPTDNTVFNISDTSAMPTINAKVRVVGVDPDPTSTTDFTWTVDLTFRRQFNPFHDPQAATGQDFIPVFGSTIQGGTLTLIVKATINGIEVSDQTNGLRILGTNPDRADIQVLLGNDSLRKIACQESDQIQFDAAANGGTGEPLQNLNGEDGWGIMQLTPPSSDGHLWNWQDNVQGGIAKFAQTTAVATGFPGRINRSQSLATLVTAYNQQERLANGLQPLTITAPAFTQVQIDEDAIRGYNGYAGNDVDFPRPGFLLHEFRIQRIGGPGTLLFVTNIDELDLTGEAAWERTPVADRPQNVGDPNYVNNVSNQSPTCN